MLISRTSILGSPGELLVSRKEAAHLGKDRVASLRFYVIPVGIVPGGVYLRGEVCLAAQPSD